MCERHEDFAQRFADELLVIDDENRKWFHAGGPLGGIMFLAVLLDERQTDFEGGTLAQLRLDGNYSAMALDDSVAHGQTQAGALHAFSRVKRLEYAFADLFFDSRTGNGKQYLDAITFAPA